MLLLVTHGLPTMLRYAHPNLGRLVQPRHYPSVRETAAAGIPWAADNDCYQGLDAPKFLGMLDAISDVPGCLFVVCPDVVADAGRTLELFDEWREQITDRALPIALALQDGMTVESVPWRLIDAVFVGGSTVYKMSRDAAAIVAHARSLDLWAHMGRVNTPGRVRYAKAIGVQSVDGSSWAMWEKTLLPKGLTLVSADQQLMLEDR